MKIKPTIIRVEEQGEGIRITMVVSHRNGTRHTGNIIKPTPDIPIERKIEIVMGVVENMLKESFA